VLWCPLLNGFYSIEVFFRCDPCASRILHRPSFLTAMLLHPKDPGFPHAAILHAIVECYRVCLQPELTLDTVRVCVPLDPAGAYSHIRDLILEVVTIPFDPTERAHAT